ncbi:hypothetical protein KY339_00400 [Candidatus Woesearchaeota archaeon]|nr:hypothetical protein [Candidatus Woesearchaeota archaeon]
MDDLSQFVRKTENFNERLLQGLVFKLMQIMEIEYESKGIKLSAERQDDEEGLFWEAMEILEHDPKVIADLRKHYDDAKGQKEEIQVTPLEGPFYEQAARFIRYSHRVLGRPKLQTPDSQERFREGMKSLFFEDAHFFGLFTPAHMGMLVEIYESEGNEILKGEATVGKDFYLVSRSKVDLPENLDVLVDSRVNLFREASSKDEKNARKRSAFQFIRAMDEKNARRRHAFHFIRAVTGYTKEQTESRLQDALAYTNSEYPECERIITTLVENPHYTFHNVPNEPREFARFKKAMPILRQAFEDKKITDEEKLMLKFIYKNMVGGCTKKVQSYLMDQKSIEKLVMQPGLGGERENMDLTAYLKQQKK